MQFDMYIFLQEYFLYNTYEDQSQLNVQICKE
jgi:hypothetical protein